MISLDVPEAEIYRFDYDRDVFLSLKNETVWNQQTMFMYGREVKQPRLTAWYGDSDTVYKYSGIKNIPLPWTDLLLEIRSDMEEFAGPLNSVLLNYYRDGNDSIGFHSDDEPELGPTIISLSFGSPRTLIFRHKRSIYPDVKIEQRDRTGIMMRGDTQKNWLHGIKKVKFAGPRINLTFRMIDVSLSR